MREEGGGRERGKDPGIVLKYVCFFLVYARIFTDTSKIPYICVRATEGSAQDWIRRIDNKQSRTRGEAIFYLPVRNFPRIAAFRSLGRKESPTSAAGRGKREKTDDRGYATDDGVTREGER